MFEPFWSKTDKLVLAVSGGVDSVVLLHIMQQKVPKEQLVVAHVNHFMRDNAKKDQAFVKQLAQHYGITFVTNDSAPPLSSEQDARVFRYDFLTQVAQLHQASFIVTAHHQDDQVETILLQLFRGNGLESVSGMRPLRSVNDYCQLARPLLQCTKASLYDYAKQQQLHYVEDETNTDEVFKRNWIRLTLLPLLRQEYPAIDKQIISFGIALRDVLKDTSSVALKKTLEIDWFSQLTDFEKSDYLGRWLAQYGVKTQSNIEVISKLSNQVNGQKEISLGKGYIYRQTYTIGEILLVLDNQDDKHEIVVFNESEMIVENYKLSVHQNYGIAIWQQQLPLSIRNIKAGDKLKCAFGHKKISRLMIDAKIPKHERSRIKVLVDNNEQILSVLDERLLHLSKWRETDKIENENDIFFVRIERIKSQ